MAQLGIKAVNDIPTEFDADFWFAGREEGTDLHAVMMCLGNHIKMSNHQPDSQGAAFDRGSQLITVIGRALTRKTTPGWGR
jgi:hypothetical protein